MKITGTMPQSILIIRPSAMGDIIMASPMLAALRRAYPQARICWLVEPGFADLLRHNRDLDEVILWPKGEWRRLVREKRFLELFRHILALRRELRSYNFDLAIDAVGLAKSRLLLACSGAKVKIGFDSKEPGSFLLDKKVVKLRNSSEMSSEYKQMILALGVETGDFSPKITLSNAAIDEAHRLLGEYGIMGKFVVFAPFTTRPQKHWIDERWAELAAILYRKYSLPVVILGGPSDTEHGDKIASMSEVPIINLAGKSSLLASSALISFAHLLVGVDTGLTHLGTAFKCPTIALFGSTCPYLTTPSTLTIVIYNKMACSPCRRRPSCEGRYDCFQMITSEKILNSYDELKDRI